MHRAVSGQVWSEGTGAVANAATLKTCTEALAADGRRLSGARLRQAVGNLCCQMRGIMGHSSEQGPCMVVAVKVTGQAVVVAAAVW